MPSDAFGCLRMPSGSLCVTAEVLEATPRELKCITPHISGWRFQQLWNGSAKSFAHSQQPSDAQRCPAMPSSATDGNFNIFQQISTLSSGLPDATC